MKKEMTRIVLINSSPKIGEASVSGMLTAMLEKQMQTEGLEVNLVDVRKSITKGTTQNDFAIMAGADALVFTFPLYVFCLPGMLMRFLQDYYQFWQHRTDKVSGTRIFAVVNCGFPEPDINEEAVRVIQNFSRKTNSHFRFGILIGGGGMLIGAQDAPFMRKITAQLNEAFKLIAEDVKNDDQNALGNISVQMNFPRKLYFYMGDRGWIQQAKKNGLKKKDLYRQPYRDNK